MTKPSHTPSNQPDPAPFFTVHTALILLAAAFIGAVVGGLTFLSGGPVAGAVLAGLIGFGTSVPVLRSLIR
ncbi:hypothetical protein GCM10022243_15980 [Saccharothrix violaceirubra]|uniref:Uncharacterized protein n=1 Tax=Saccharothrix violaceirubra TaxID=413306 RepID=A0A7W7WXK3_9PSEU|nr:hypothetical protein [Saccharothrix violaceirubra]MBB4967475.1 hypothetical protein [Saccharothrix violaceirubra]